jgi:hypothetical protein
MSNIPLSATGIEERALPPIWRDGVKSTARFDWYTKLLVDWSLVRGGKPVVAEFIAAMALESSLDNLILGNNARNGSDNAGVGVGWCQLDTQWHVADLDKLHWLRSDPFASALYVTDPANGLCVQGGIRTHFNKTRWHAWDAARIDPVEGWSPLKEAEAAYDRVVGA